MKDKLVKFNHKATYYRMRKIGVAFAFVSAFSLSVVLPVSVSLVNAAKADNEQREVQDDKEVNTLVMHVDSYYC